MFFEETVTPVRTTARTFGRGELVSDARTVAEENPAILWPGRQLGPYRLIERLGQGGQGEVWKTRRVEPQGALVALKILKPELAHNPTRMAQFRREAQRGARLTGKSLLAAYELSLIDGFHCMAMPFVRGTALRDVIKWRVAFVSGEETEHLHPFVSLPEAEYYAAITAALAEAALALSEVHEKRIAHRDIKPANLLLENRWGGGVYLCDFGLGRDLDVATCDQMRDGAGTPIYMAPERLLLFAADEIKCDIYSMGVTLFESLLLEKPFRVPAEVTGPCLAPHLARAVPKPARQIDPDFPHDLEAVITKAMARDPLRRFESARELACSLQQFVANNPSRSRRGPGATTYGTLLRGTHARSRRGRAYVVDHADVACGPP